MVNDVDLNAVRHQPRHYRLLTPNPPINAFSAGNCSPLHRCSLCSLMSRLVHVAEPLVRLFLRDALLGRTNRLAAIKSDSLTARRALVLLDFLLRVIRAS